MTPIEIIAAAHVAATLIVGAVHAVLILAGLRAMRRASDARDRALAAQERAADQRHAEAMQGLREQGAAFREHTSALAVLVARAAPAAD